MLNDFFGDRIILEGLWRTRSLDLTFLTSWCGLLNVREYKNSQRAIRVQHIKVNTENSTGSIMAEALTRVSRSMAKIQNYNVLKLGATLYRSLCSRKSINDKVNLELKYYVYICPLVCLVYTNATTPTPNLIHIDQAVLGR
jgi:hypothetical protein